MLHHFDWIGLSLDYTPAKRIWRGGGGGGGYTGFTLSTRPPPVCRRHGVRCVSQVYFGISILNFACWLHHWQKPNDLQQRYFQNGRLAVILVCSVSGLCGRHGFRSVNQICFKISATNFLWMSFVAMGWSLLIFSVARSKWHFSVSGLFRRHGFRSVTRVSIVISVSNSCACRLWLWAEAYWLLAMSFSKWPPGGHFGFFSFGSLTLIVRLWISSPNFNITLLVYMDRRLLIFNDVTFKMATWQPYKIFCFRTITVIGLWISDPNFISTFPVCMGRNLSIISDATF